MTLDFATLDALRIHHPAWRLLRSDHAPLVASFLHRVFVAPNVRVMAAADLSEALEDELYALRQQRGDESLFPKSGIEYLNDWAAPDKGWLRKFYRPGTDEAQFDLTPATEKAIALPLNMFYNTGIATYVWVLTNRKPEERQGKVQLIDATQWSHPLRKNMGKKNCELTSDDIQRICDTFLAFKETEQSKIFPNDAFGYWKVKVERPLRLHSQLTRQRIETLRFASGDTEIRNALYDKLGDALFENPASIRKELEKFVDDWGKADSESDDEEEGEGAARKALPEAKKKKLLNDSTWKRDAMLVNVATKLRESLGDNLFEDHNIFLEKIGGMLKKLGLKPCAADLKLIINAVSWRVEDAPRVIKKVHKPGKTKPDPLRGLFESQIDDKACVIEYEPDSELRDYEQIPLLEEGGIEAFIRREVLPYTPDAWIVEADTKIGFEVSFTRHFYKPPVLRTLAEISADILALEQETEGLLVEIVGGMS
jgi:type I restriction enzyme M protein